MNNPLQKYYRQPKIYVSLPSKGLYYPENVLDGDPSNIPVFAMTGMDELIMKTPDALFNGESTIKVIESCCPYIKNARKIPSLDIDTILASIRIATFGNDISITNTCKSCGQESDYDIPLQSIIDHYSTKTFDNRLHLTKEITVNFKPLLYEEINNFNLENFQFQRQLNSIRLIEDLVQRQEEVNNIYKKLSEIQIKILFSSIESIEIPDGIVTNIEFIKEWLANVDRELYNKIKQKLEDNKTIWTMPKHSIKCNECGFEDELEIMLDQSHFFV